MSDTDKRYTVVMDAGSSRTKVGFSGQDTPKFIFPTLLGSLNPNSNLAGTGSKQVYIGEEACMKREVLNLQKPIEHGLISNWEDLNKIWHYIYYTRLCVQPSDHACLFAEAPKNPKQNKEKAMQTMFQNFSVPAYYAANHAFLSLCASGKTVGLVLEVGDGVTHAAPIADGVMINAAVERSLAIGSDQTEWLRSILSKDDAHFAATVDHYTACQIKEAMCSVSQDFEQQSSEAAQPSLEGTKLGIDERTYTLPDGYTLKIGLPRIMCGQLLFKPQLMGKEQMGIHESVFSSILKCDIELRKDLLANIVLSGGVTTMEGFANRMNKEIVNLAPSTTKVKVSASDDRQNQVWIGGSILASLSSFSTVWISRSEYDESGLSVVHRKCF